MCASSFLFASCGWRPVARLPVILPQCSVGNQPCLSLRSGHHTRLFARLCVCVCMCVCVRLSDTSRDLWACMHVMCLCVCVHVMSVCVTLWLCQYVTLCRWVVCVMWCCLCVTCGHEMCLWVVCVCDVVLSVCDLWVYIYAGRHWGTAA